jgi:5-methylcytosine-specific restriction endonuclease McrA
MDLIKASVKKRDDHTCQKCGKQVEGSNCQVSHVIPVSAGNALSFDPLNMKVLCMHDHLHWWHKNPIEATEWFKKKFPRRWKYLESHRNDEVHWKEADYLRMIEEAKEL